MSSDQKLDRPVNIQFLALGRNNPLIPCLSLRPPEMAKALGVS